MDDKLFWENLIKILKRGKWEMHGDEMMVYAAIVNECNKRGQPKPKMNVEQVESMSSAHKPEPSVASKGKK